MTDKALENATTNTLAGEEAQINANQNSYTPSAEYALRMLEAITLDTEAIKQAIAKVSLETDNGVAHIIDAREETNRELISFYKKMYERTKCHQLFVLIFFRVTSRASFHLGKNLSINAWKRAL